MKDIREAIHGLATPFKGEKDRKRLLAQIGDVNYVLLGEASHGTSEFYTHRAELSKQLIVEKGFRFIAVEGDWPSCYMLNRYIKGYPDSGSNVREALGDFNRWPTWMWANREIMEFAEWLRHYNKDKPHHEKVGFYGIDIYSLWESMDEIVKYLQNKDGSDLTAVRRALQCFEPYGKNEQSYGISASLYGEGCEEEVIALLRSLQDRWKHLQTQDEAREKALSAELNALAVKGAEGYYRTMIRHDAESWNVRDRHMIDVLEKLMEFYGAGARSIVWAHNTHIGDARATDMIEEGMVNIGQLLREKHSGNVYAIGFGTYQGTVVAGTEWGEPQEVMTVPPALPNSWEELLHREGAEDKLLIFDNEESSLNDVTIGHRAIGVVYHPKWEKGNYVPTVIPKRYDAFIFIDQTKALTPIAAEQMYV
ncbi:erythromycin esterase family protein [Paenibacillus rigui]|uniref:Protein-L-isoaspartate O-methyltransferase n=1 Tax=Paenibacillus rigui TaxID=554312 RepID=A0A229UKC8_9BACL|nr:erythromycin esterase family protein [Paenibacillus rigui]OXM83856.1 protein-L-isoaspartate O-methyltransferase [Paenibacillus rigui]